MTALEPTDLAYAAGLFDGEGAVTIFKHKRSNHYEVQVVIANTDEAMMAWLNARWPGYLRVQKRRPTEVHWKLIWRWTLQSKKAEAFLRDIRPYLITKAARVDLALALRETTHQNWRGLSQKGGQRVPPNIVDLRERLMVEMKEANRRGPI